MVHIRATKANMLIKFLSNCFQNVLVAPGPGIDIEANVFGIHSHDAYQTIDCRLLKSSIQYQCLLLTVKLLTLEGTSSVFITHAVSR
jgi:hypothetical protein